MIPSESKPDVVIVGAGIAGSVLAISLAGSGHSVTLLEKSTVHVDRVRGEFIVPWGVAEAKTLGILDVLASAGGNYIPEYVTPSMLPRWPPVPRCFAASIAFRSVPGFLLELNSRNPA
jgi:choline dehydrogenase-like flavoprotein